MDSAALKVHRAKKKGIWEGIKHLYITEIPADPTQKEFRVSTIIL